MTASDRLFIFDLHNTLYDEVMEYGGAMQAALELVFKAAADQGIPLDEDLFCAQLSAAHARLGSDWDEEAWKEVEELKKLPNHREISNQAASTFLQTSELLTRQYAYAKTIQALRHASAMGAAVYIATEASLSALGNALRHLNLEGSVTGAYGWPSRKPPSPGQTPLHVFPTDPHDPSQCLEKPHPLILGTILLAEAKRRGMIPANVTSEDVFECARGIDIDLTPLRKKVPPGARQAEKALEALQTRLILREGPHKAALEALKSNTFYIGDSFFRDGFLARNADIPFIFAQYGKTVAEADCARHDRARDTMIRVTGWDKFLLQLTQEAGRLPELTGLITPFFTCEEGFQDFLEATGEHHE